MRLVIFSYPCRTAAVLLEHLGDVGIRPCAVLLERGSALRRLGRVRRVVGWRGVVVLGFRKALASAGLLRYEGWRGDELYQQHTDELVVVPSLNSPECLEALRRIEPDIAIIGEAGILRREIFSAPRLGTLNMHPGLLPGFRGLSSSYWALCAGEDVGGTLHFIDEGIDTGPVVHRTVVPVVSGDTYAKLSQRILAANLQMLEQALRELHRTGSIRSIPQPCGIGRTYSVAPPKARRLAERLLSERAVTCESRE